VQYLVKEQGFDVNFPRPSDLCTPLHLSIWTKQPELSSLLLDLGADPLQVNAYGENCIEMLKTVDLWKAKCLNIVWLDFELDALPIDALAAGTKPRVVECCVIITTNDLEIVDQKEWTVHFSEAEIKGMSPWHQQHFTSTEKGGNGLFEASLASSTTTEQLEQELLEFLQLHCVERINMLAGNSVHVDQQVLVLSMPKVAKFLSHRVLDVSVLNTIAARWYPETLQGLASCYDTYNHRSRGDVLSSIAQLKFYQGGLLKQANCGRQGAVTAEQEGSKPAVSAVVELVSVVSTVVEEPK